MRWMVILLFSFCCIHPLRAQDNGYNYTDRIALAIPASQTNTTKDIADYIKAHFDTDGKRVRAIYTWVTNNIKYDKDSIHRVILDEDNEERVTYALKRRRGVCENFAAIFTDICIKAGINSYTIEGYSRQNGSIDRSPHVWCAAFINSQWFLYDPTWDAGFISRGFFVNQIQTNFFQVSPSNFIYTHLPFDPLFQFLNYPVSYKEFYRGSKQANKSNSYFNYMDSIRAYNKSDSLSRYLSALSRIGNFDWPASRIDTKIKRIKLEIELIYQDRDMALYHSAIADYNKGIDILNDYINYRNNQFLPAKTNDEVQRMFDKISKKIVNANQKLKEVNLSKATLTLNTGGIQEKLDELAVNVKEQQTFFKNHLSEIK
ncbi:MAG TPA: transglutaminase domain-containing protein [Hanamia sp.]|nr:transglutaminase domain-containing protein [Hanamia sp.]